MTNLFKSADNIAIYCSSVVWKPAAEPLRHKEMMLPSCGHEEKTHKKIQTVKDKLYIWI